MNRQGNGYSALSEGSLWTENICPPQADKGSRSPINPAAKARASRKQAGGTDGRTSHQERGKQVCGVMASMVSHHGKAQINVWRRGSLMKACLCFSERRKRKNRRRERRSSGLRCRFECLKWSCVSLWINSEFHHGGVGRVGVSSQGDLGANLSPAL